MSEHKNKPSDNDKNSGVRIIYIMTFGVILLLTIVKLLIG